MSMTPGRPHDATVHHSRTRPEAEAIARKMRGENDWFRHDGKNVEEPEAPVARLTTENANEIAEKNKGHPDEWFEHNAENLPEPPPPERCPTEESKAAQEKVQGKDEKWFKMEENQDYYSPKPKNRITEPRGQEIKDKNGKAHSNEWYRHEHGAGEPAPDQEAPRHRCPSAQSEENQRRMKGSTGMPDWYGHHNGKEERDELGNTPRGKPHPRYTSSEAGEYLQRNKDGSAASWYSHDHQGEPAPQAVASPRVTSSEGQAIASRLKGESENWFSHDGNKGSPSKVDKYRSREAQEMVDRSRGGAMNQVMNMDENKGYQSTRQARVKGEAQDIAAKNQQGLMDKYLSEDKNRGYNSARPAPRVKPEAQDMAEKNKGMMGDCMQGYLPDPVEHSHKRVKPEAEQNAQKHAGSSMGKLLAGDLSQSDRRVGGRAVKPEAEMYASRNQGTLKGLMDNYGQMSVSERPSPRPASSEAAAIAAKHKGSVASCFTYDNY